MELAKEFVINDPEDLLECPYESSHMIRAKRMTYHLAKCRANHACSEMARCPYNASHEVYAVELRYHMAICEDKQRVQGKIVQETWERENETKGCVETPSYTPLNVWGESWEDDLPVESVFAMGRVHVQHQPRSTRTPVRREQPAKPAGVIITEEERNSLTGRQLQQLHMQRKAEAQQQKEERTQVPSAKLRAPHQLSQSLAVHENRQLQDIYQQALPEQKHRAVALGRGRGMLGAGANAAGREGGVIPKPGANTTVSATGVGRGLLGRGVVSPPPGFSTTSGAGLPSSVGLPNGGLGDAAMSKGGNTWQPAGPRGRGIGRGGSGDFTSLPGAMLGHQLAGRGGVGTAGGMSVAASDFGGEAWAPAESAGGKVRGLNPQGMDMGFARRGEPGGPYSASSHLQAASSQGAGYSTALYGQPYGSDSGTDDDLAEQFQDLGWVGGGYIDEVPSPKFSSSATSLGSNPRPYPGSWADEVDTTYPMQQSGTSTPSSHSLTSDSDMKDCSSAEEAGKQLKKIIKKLRQIEQLEAKVKAGFVLDKDSEKKRQSRPLLQQEADQLKLKFNLQQDGQCHLYCDHPGRGVL